MWDQVLILIIRGRGVILRCVKCERTCERAIDDREGMEDEKVQDERKIVGSPLLSGFKTKSIVGSPLL